MKPFRSALRPPAVVAAVVLALFLSGCASVNHLRDAQAAFSEASSLHNQLQLTTQWEAGPEAVVTNGAAEQTLQMQVLYGSALHSLRQLDGDRKQLEADGLWGVACTLKSLTQWRLGLYNEAVATARQARTEGAKLLPRDDALLTALPALVRNSEAFVLVKTGTARRLTDAEFASARRLLADPTDGALAILESARGRPGIDPQLDAYLLQAKLAAHVNLADLHLRRPDQPRPENEVATAKADLAAFLQQLNTTGLPDATRSNIVDTWRRTQAF